MNLYKKNISILIILSLLWNFIFNIDFVLAENKNNFEINNNLADLNKDTAGIIIKFREDFVNFKNSSSIQTINNIALNNGLDLVDSIEDSNISLFDIKDKNISIDKLLSNLEKNSSIEIVQPNYLYNIASINSSDIEKDKLWWLDNFWQTISSQAWFTWSDISWNKASKIFSWVTNVSNTWVIVAVLDSWVAYDHPDLINNMWDWSNCKNENWNFLWNCIHWYDFANNDKNPAPLTETHGTHVAWTIAAQMNNWTWILWVNPNAKIMALRMWDSSFTTMSIIKSIYFAKENWAKIINASFWARWTSAFDILEYQAVKDFTDAGWLFIAAAGNNNQDNDNINNRFFPASFGITNYVASNGTLTWSTWSWITTYTWITNIISVAATDNRDSLAVFSNYWLSSVDLWAPGVSIYSTILDTTDLFSSVLISDYLTWWTKNNWWNASSVLWTDLSTEYLTWADSYIEKQISTLWLNNTNLEFRVWCDAWKNSAGLNNYSTDYLDLSFSTWGAFTSIDKYNYTSSSMANPANWWYYWDISINLSNYNSSDFKFRFSWHTDDISDAWLWWCYIWPLSLTNSNNWLANQYWYLNWTSMATPHVAWLASLAWSYKPSLSALQI